MTPKEALAKAIDAAGGQAPLARKINTEQPRVWYWLHKAERAPAEFVSPIVAAIDGAVLPHELRPDIFPPPVKLKGASQ